MGKKVWYEIKLTNNIDNYEEVIAKVKSKGLANITLNNFKNIYDKTNYHVTIN